MTGAGTGVTLDPSGSVLPGVSIQLTNQDTTEAQFTTSDQEGRFWFMLLSPGKHNVMVDLVGYKPFVTDIDVQADQKITIKADLSPGSVSQAPPEIKK
jgi:hypothetical protein